MKIHRSGPAGPMLAAAFALSLSVRADLYEDVVAKQAPLVYFDMNDFPGVANLAATVDNTPAGVTPVAAVGAGVAAGQDFFTGSTADLSSAGGFPGFDAANTWIRMNGSATGMINNLLDGGTAGGLTKGRGSVSLWFSSTGTTIQMLYYASPVTGGDGFGDQNEMHVNLNGTGNIQFFNRLTDIGGVNVNLTSSQTYNDGAWHHVVATWSIDDNQMALHINGGAGAGGETLTASLQGSTSRIGFTAAHRLGHAAAGTRFFAGDMDAVALWNRPLSGSEVRLQYFAATLGAGDSDTDGLPDYWEMAFGLDPGDNGSGNIDNGPNGDPDADDATNLQEFNHGTAPDNPDTDGDGLLDGVETNTGIFVNAGNTGTNPLSRDTDGDGLSDWDEVNVHATNPNLADSDGDGFRDPVELAAGTDPNDPADFPKLPLGGGTWNVRTVRDFNNDLSTLQQAMLLLNPSFKASGSQGDIQGVSGGAISTSQAHDVIAVDHPSVINYTTGATAGNFGGDNLYNTSGFLPVDTQAAHSRIATLVEGEIFIQEAGVYTFLVNSADGHRLRINGLDGVTVTRDETNHGPQNFLGSVELGVGFHTIQLIDYNAAGEGALELAIYKGRGEINAFTSAEDFMLLEPFDPTDTDNDGMADQWEIFFFGSIAAKNEMSDTDGDGLPDHLEFANRTDPLEEDTDGDGLSDDDEVFIHFTDPRLADTDGDGLTDGQEVALGTFPLEFDSDGDGFGDGTEVANSTDPQDQFSFPAQGRIIWVTSGDNGGELEFTDPTSKFFGEVNDFQFIRLLGSNGYGVAVRMGGDGYHDGNGGPNVTEANGADLVIISRNNNSGGFINRKAEWNSITTPVLSLSAYVTRFTRLAWLPGDPGPPVVQDGVTEFSFANWMVLDAGDPAFDGLGISNNMQVDSSTGSSSLNNGITNLGNGTLVARAANAVDQIAMVRWQAGVPFFDGGATPAGPRMYMSMGSGGVNPAPGQFNLTNLGVQMLLNVVDDFVPDAPSGGTYGEWIADFRTQLQIMTGGSITAELPDADADGDGYINLVELAFGLDPTIDSRPGGPDPNAGNVPAYSLSGGQPSLLYRLSPANLAGSGGSAPITVTGQQSVDLESWSSLAPVNLGGNQYRLTVPANGPARFGRLFINLPPAP